MLGLLLVVWTGIAAAAESGHEPIDRVARCYQSMERLHLVDGAYHSRLIGGKLGYPDSVMVTAAYDKKTWRNGYVLAVADPSGGRLYFGWGLRSEIQGLPSSPLYVYSAISRASRHPTRGGLGPFAVFFVPDEVPTAYFWETPKKVAVGSEALPDRSDDPAFRAVIEKELEDRLNDLTRNFESSSRRVSTAQFRKKYPEYLFKETAFEEACRFESASLKKAVDDFRAASLKLISVGSSGGTPSLQ